SRSTGWTSPTRRPSRARSSLPERRAGARRERRQHGAPLGRSRDPDSAALARLRDRAREDLGLVADLAPRVAVDAKDLAELLPQRDGDLHLELLAVDLDRRRGRRLPRQDDGEDQSDERQHPEEERAPAEHYSASSSSAGTSRIGRAGLPTTTARGGTSRTT